MLIQLRITSILMIFAALAFSACGGGGNDSKLAAPSVPANVTTSAGSRDVTVTWDTVSGAESYNIYYKTSIGVTTSDTKITGATSPYLQSPLSNGTTYYYAVSAVSAGGESSLSGEVSAMPTFKTPEIQKMLASDAQAGDVFGNSVSISGDYAIVGAYCEDGGIGDPLPNAGAAYIFHRTGMNTWDAGTKITAPDAQAGDYFGMSVSISGDYAIIGATKNGGAGAAYIFHRTGMNTWDAGTKIVASDAQADDNFGGSVSISGDYAIVGAQAEDGGIGDPLTNAGAAYIFHRTDTNTWDAGTKIVAIDSTAGDVFGISVSISGDYAIVGAAFEDGGIIDPLTNAGAAYIFHRTGTNTWDTGTKIMSSDAQVGNDFGWSVSISGDYAIVGAIYANGVTGAAYIFHRTDTNTWDAGTKITAPDAQANDYFGISVSISGNYAIVGAYCEDGGIGDPLTNAGAAYIFHKTDTNTWDAGTKITAPDAQANDYFGISVSISGDYAIVGAHGEDGGTGDPLAEAGAAYIY